MIFSTGKKNILIISSVIFILFSCDKFQYSVYDNTLKENQEDLTNKNLNEINVLPYKKNFKFAAIADIHLNYDNLATVIDSLNKRNDIEFVIIAGDMTDKGLLEEYLLDNHFFSQLKVPYFTVAGNHDLGTQYGNGETIYRQMFGKFNYTEFINGIKFIFFNSNINVYNNYLDFNWLNNQLSDTLLTNKFILVAHQYPGAVAYNVSDSLRHIYWNCLKNPHILYSIFGHEHFYMNNDSLRFVIVDAIRLRKQYCIITIKDSKATVEEIVLNSH